MEQIESPVAYPTVMVTDSVIERLNQVCQQILLGIIIHNLMNFDEKFVSDKVVMARLQGTMEFHQQWKLNSMSVKGNNPASWTPKAHE